MIQVKRCHGCFLSPHRHPREQANELCMHCKSGYIVYLYHESDYIANNEHSSDNPRVNIAVLVAYAVAHKSSICYVVEGQKRGWRCD